MGSRLPLILLQLALIGVAILAGAELRAHLRAQSLESDFESFQRMRAHTLQSDPEKGPALVGARRRELIEQLASARTILFIPPRIDMLRTQLLFEAAHESQQGSNPVTGEPDPPTAAQARGKCEALEALTDGLERNPFDPDYLITWAVLERELGAKCGFDAPVRDVDGVVSFAERLAPWRNRVMYMALTYFFEKRDHEKVLELARNLLERSPAVPELQSRFIFSQLNGGDDLRRVLPAKFPQVVSWSRRLASLEADRYANFSAALEEIQLEALRGLPRRCHEDPKARESCIRQTLDLLPFVAGNRPRREADAALAKLLPEVSEARAYLEERATLDEIDVLRGMTRSDTQPARNNLYNWERDTTVYLDDYFSSVGAYVPPGNIVKRIELVGDARAKQPELKAVRLFVSNDNQKWHDFTGDIRVRAVVLDRSPLITIDVPPTQFRYWKVHFSSAQKGSSFGGPLRRFIRFLAADAPAKPSNGDRSD